MSQDFTGARFDGETYDPALDQRRLSTALAAVYRALVSESRWWTLAELTDYATEKLGRPVSEAGVSARLRDLRKERFGRHDVERKRLDDDGGTWVYRLNEKPVENEAVKPVPLPPGPPVVVRTRSNPIERRGLRPDHSMPLTCPRCGWPATHLVTPYYESPWIAHGGICGECSMDAAAHFDEVGWPPRRTS